MYTFLCRILPNYFYRKRSPRPRLIISTVCFVGKTLPYSTSMFLFDAFNILLIDSVHDVAFLTRNFEEKCKTCTVTFSYSSKTNSHSLLKYSRLVTGLVSVKQMPSVLSLKFVFTKPMFNRL